ncbi:MAG: exosome complex protein Rrp4 [Candidatus Diapherotrites archaeon]|nr:exosome complex protein Rrp4 [Candidatus Diapherotrites archaeon]
MTDRKIVVPGELLTDQRKKLGEHVFVDEGMVYADSLGLAEQDSDGVRVIPLQGRYMPQAEDLIVGIIAREEFSGYIVDINSFYYSFVRKDNLRKPLEKGTVISAKITSVNEINEAELDQIRVFYDGEVLDVSPVKVPRIIGKKGSMLEVLTKGTGSSIMAGRNGRVWIKDGNTALLKKAIKKIEDEAHLSNLTVRITEFIEREKKQALKAK